MVLHNTVSTVGSNRVPERAAAVLTGSRRFLAKLFGEREDFREQGLTNVKSIVDHSVQFSQNIAHQPLTVCFQEEAKGSNHGKPQLLGRSSRRAIVNQDLTGKNPDRERYRLSLTGFEGGFPQERITDWWQLHDAHPWRRLPH